VGIPILISVGAAIVVGCGGFLLGWRAARATARREDGDAKIALGALPWSLLAVGLVAVAATTAFLARSPGVDQPVVSVPAGGDDATTADQAGADQAGIGSEPQEPQEPEPQEPEPPEQRTSAPIASASQPPDWPALPACFDDYLAHESPAARRPHYVAENKTSVFTPADVTSLMLVDDDRIVGALRISYAFVGRGSFSAHDVIDASCNAVDFSEDEGDAPPAPSGTGQLTVAFTVRGQPYELFVEREAVLQAAATLRPAQ
jgi:hypothetical protein